MVCSGGVIVKRKWVESKMATLNNELQTLRVRLDETQGLAVQLQNAIILRHGQLQAYEDVLAELVKK